MRRSHASGGLVAALLLLVILDFGHGLHLEVVNKKSSLQPGNIHLRQKREWIIPPVVIPEEQDNSYKNPIARIQSDVKLDPRMRIRYSIVGRGVTEPPLGIFVINERTGDLNVTGIVDREEIPMFFLKGYARNEAGEDVEPPIDLRVSVEDINDNNPIFTQEIFAGSVEEMSAANVLVMVLNATDADQPNTINSKLAYRILSQEPGQSSLFMVTKNGEVLTTATVLDREEQSSYTLVVEVRDRDGDLNGGLAGTAKVKVKVLDVNDNIPILEKEQYEGDVEENVAGVEILRMKVFDNDEQFTDNWFANFSIISGNEGNFFEIVLDEETNEGVLMLVKEADYEVMQSAELSVVVSNRAEYHSSIKHLVVGGGGGAGGAGGAGAGGGVVAGGGGGKSIPIKVKVKNVKEGPVFKPRKKILNVPEGKKKIINTIIGSYQAFDGDSGKVAENVKYAKEYDPDNWFTIDPVTADIKLIKIPDRESIYVVDGSYVAKILAISEDLPGKTATGTIAIEVEDMNDNCPILINPDQTVCTDTPFINMTAVDKDNYPNGAPLKFTVLDEPAGNAQFWSIGKTESSSAQLIPKNIWEGSHQVQVLITDNQGLSCPEKQVLKLTVCTCEKGVPGCISRHADKSVGLGGGAVALMILACLLLLLVPILLLACLCGGGGSGIKGLSTVVYGPVESEPVGNKEGPVPEDAIVPVGFGAIGVAGGAGAGAGNMKGNGVVFDSGDGYDYSSKGWYNSSMHYGEQENLLTSGGMAAGGGMVMKGFMASGGGYAAGNQASFGASGAGGSQAALNEDFMRGYFYDKVMCCADEDMAQAAKDCLLMYSQEGTESLAGSVGCCSLIESEYEDNAYLDDLGLKFKVLAEICQGIDITTDTGISKYTAYEDVRQSTITSEAMADIDLVNEEEETEQHGYTMETAYTSSETKIQKPEQIVRENIVTEESVANSRYIQEPIMRGNVIVTEKSYTRAPTVILEPIHTQNVLVTERVIRPANSIHSLVDFDGVIRSDKEYSSLVTEAPSSQYLLVTERVLGPSSGVSAAVSIPDVSIGQNVIVTERRFAPISEINGSVVVPTEISSGHGMVKESVSVLNGGNQEIPSSESTMGKSTSRVTKYSKVQYSRS
ncbi:desmoglein-2 [Gastrophryne carolinensis]